MKKAWFPKDTRDGVKKEAVNYINKLIGRARRLDKDFNPNEIRVLLAQEIEYNFQGSIFKRYQKAQRWVAEFIWKNLDITKKLKEQEKLEV